MNNDDGIILQMQEDGSWGIKEEPYCTVEFQTKEDYERLEEVLEKHQKNRWIPVSEKLPTTDGRFEVTIKGAKGKRHVEMCDFHKDAHFHNWGGKWNEMNVIAWRSRPEPYRGEAK